MPTPACAPVHQPIQSPHRQFRCRHARRDGRGPHGADARAHRARDSRAQPRRRGAGAGRHPHARRAAGPAAGRDDPRDQPARGPDRRARHHAVSRRLDAPRGRRAAGGPPHRDSVLHRRQAHPARRRRAVHGPDDSSGARRAHRVRAAARRFSSSCSSTAATASCRSRPTTSARTCRLRCPRACRCTCMEIDGRDEVEIQDHEEGSARHRRPVTRDEIYLILDTADAMREIGERPIKKVPDAARQDRSSTCSTSRARAPGRRSRSPRSGSAPTR